MKYEDTAKLPKPISLHFQKKANNEKDKDTVQPTVINDMYIRRYALDYNNENKIYDKDNEDIWELTQLQLSFKNIW